jgi:hypothetical protein
MTTFLCPRSKIWKIVATDPPERIKYQIILLSISSEIFLGVINDMVCAERTHKVLHARVIHPGNLSPIQFGKLHCKRTGATAGPTDQHLLPRLDLSFTANPLQGYHCRLRDGSYFLECHTRWFQRQGTGVELRQTRTAAMTECDLKPSSLRPLR